MTVQKSITIDAEILAAVQTLVKAGIEQDYAVSEIVELVRGYLAAEQEQG